MRLAARGSGGVFLLPCHGAAGELLSFLWTIQRIVDKLEERLFLASKPFEMKGSS